MEHAAEIAVKLRAAILVVVCLPDNSDFHEMCYERCVIGKLPTFTVSKCTVNNSNRAVMKKFEVIL